MPTREQLMARLDLSMCLNSDDYLPPWPPTIFFVLSDVVEVPAEEQG